MTTSEEPERLLYKGTPLERQLLEGWSEVQVGSAELERSWQALEAASRKSFVRERASRKLTVALMAAAVLAAIVIWRRRAPDEPIAPIAREVPRAVSAGGACRPRQTRCTDGKVSECGADLRWGEPKSCGPFATGCDVASQVCECGDPQHALASPDGDVKVERWAISFDGLLNAGWSKSNLLSVWQTNGTTKREWPWQADQRKALIWVAPNRIVLASHFGKHRTTLSLLDVSKPRLTLIRPIEVPGLWIHHLVLEPGSNVNGKLGTLLAAESCQGEPRRIELDETASGRQ